MWALGNHKNWANFIMNSNNSLTKTKTKYKMYCSYINNKL